MDNKSYLTAISRQKLALPIRKHLLNSLTNPCSRTLDYGCGRGQDADKLGMVKYDPHFFPEVPTGPFDTVYCGYVLNVMLKHQAQRVVRNIQDLMRDKRSIAYIVVRRDLLKGGAVTGKGTYQRKVVLKGARLEKEYAAYALYSVRKDDTVEVW